MVATKIIATLIFLILIPRAGIEMPPPIKEEAQKASSPAFGYASWYSKKSCQREGTSGIYTASGERFNENDLTCAMRSRNFGKLYKVTNLQNGKSIIVRHNDFGPAKKLYNQGRIIDLSKEAFRRIADLKQGIIKVKVEEVD